MNLFPHLWGLKPPKSFHLFSFLIKKIGKKIPIGKVWEAKQPLLLTGEISPNCIIKILKIEDE